MFSNLTDKQLEEQLETCYINLNASTERTGSAHYGPGGYQKLVQSRYDQLHAEKQRREKIKKALNASAESANL